jgi:adenylate kinase family enzyme
MKDLTTTDIEIITQWLGTGAINIFGLPFAGKDTHGHRLAELFGASIMGGGDILRNSVIPPHVKEIIDSGRLAPTDDYVRIVLPYLSREEFADRPLVLSSVGRWHGEEPGVIEAAAAANHPLKAVLFLSVSEAVAHERFVASREDETRGKRADDAEHILATRFTEFRDKTLPVIEFYREKGTLIEVDGNPPKDEVHQTILRGLLRLAQNA